MALPDGTTDMRLSFTTIAIAILVNLMFAFNMIAMKEVVDATSPLLSLSLRMTAVFLLCAPAFRLMPGRNRTLALYGFFNGGLFLLILNLALAMATNVSALAIAGQLSVPFALLLGALLLHDHLSRAKFLGVVLAFAGVTMLVFDPHIVNEVPAVLVMSLAALIWGGATLFQRKLGGVPVMTIQAWNGLIALLVLAPFALVFEHGKIGRIAEMGWVPIGWLSFSVVGSTIIGQGLLSWLLQRHPISAIMPLMLAGPVMGTVLASLYFGTRITPIMIAGGTLALAGVAMIAMVRERSAPPPPVPEVP